jgi:hypothetical protein
MIALLLVASRVLVGKPKDAGLAGLVCLTGTVAVWLIGGAQGAREPPVEERA